MTDENKPKFTPGPWRKPVCSTIHMNLPTCEERISQCLKNGEGKVVCGLSNCRMADAVLIAAAPEMYDFVHLFESFSGQCYCKILGASGQRIYEEAVRICKKARGEEDAH